MKRIGFMLSMLVSMLFGATTSHAALYFPHVAVTSEWQTEICVINPSSTETVTGNLVSYDDNGNQLATKPLTLAPNVRVQYDVGSQLPTMGSTGYIIYKNTTGWPVGYTKFSQKSGDRVAVPAVDSVNTSNIYITHIAWDPWWTGISLVNTTAAAKNITIRFNTGETRTKTLAAGQHSVFTIASLFNNQTRIDIVSAVIENASGIVGLELFAVGMGGVIGGVPLISGTAATLYYPHVASDATWWTGLVAYNPSATATQVTVKPHDPIGTALATSTQSVASGGRYFGNSMQLNLPANTASFSLESPNPMVGFELFGTFDGKRLAGFSAVDIDGDTGVFPKLEKNGWTGIAFVNTEDQPATVTLKARNDAGTSLVTATAILNAYGKWVGTPGQLFGSNPSLNNGTYVSFTADRKVAGFQLNNSTDDTKLDALPALSPSGLRVIDKALAFFKYQSTVTTGIEIVSDVIGQISDDMGGNCPTVTFNPPGIEDMEISDISKLPLPITVTANYGAGCKAEDGSTMSGQVVLALTNLTSTDTNIVLDFTLTATNLRRNGKLVLNGSMTAHIAFAGTGLTSDDAHMTSGSATVQFNNFQIAGNTISGNLTLTLNISAGTLQSITIGFNNLTAMGYSVYSGTMTLSGGDTTLLDININTSQGIVDMTLAVTEYGDTGVKINTLSPGTIAGYTVTLNNVVMDTEVCDGYPSSGSVTVSQGLSSVTKTFTSTCPVTEMMVEQGYPAYSLNLTNYLNLWQPLSRYFYLYKYLNIIR